MCRKSSDLESPGNGVQWMLALGKGPATKSDEFLEKFQTAFDPPSSFLEIYVANFFIMDIVAFMQEGIKIP